MVKFYMNEVYGESCSKLNVDGIKTILQQFYYEYAQQMNSEKLKTGIINI